MPEDFRLPRTGGGRQPREHFELRKRRRGGGGVTLRAVSNVARVEHAVRSAWQAVDRRRPLYHPRMRVDFAIIGASVVLTAIASYLGARRYGSLSIQWRYPGSMQYRGWKMGRPARTLFVVSLLLAVRAATDTPMDVVGGQGYWAFLYAGLPITIAHFAPVVIHNKKVSKAQD